MASVLNLNTTMTTQATGTTPQFQITYNPAPPLSQSALLITDSNGSTDIFSTGHKNNRFTLMWGDNWSAGTLPGSIRMAAQIDRGAIVGIHPGALWFPDGRLENNVTADVAGGFLRAGTGMPKSTTIGGYASEGDLYARADGAARTDVAVVSSGSATVVDTSITADDLGRPVTGTGVPANTYVGTVTPGTSFLLSSSPIKQVNVNGTAPGTSITVGQAYLYQNVSAGKPGTWQVRI